MSPRVLLLARWFPPTIGGIERYLEELYGRLAEDTEVLIVVPRGQSGRSDRCYRVFPTARLSRSLGSKLPLVGITARALSLVRGSDILVAGNLLTAVPVVVLGAVFRKPTVVHVYGMELNNGRLMSLKAFFLRRATRVISISDHTTARLAELGISPPRICQVLPGVDIDTFRPPTNGRPSPFRVLTVGRLAPGSRYKGHDVIAQAIRELDSEGLHVEWRIVGDGPDLDHVVGIARDLDIEPRVRFLGAVPSDTLVEEYQRASIFVMPNRAGPNGETEGFGMVFTEAQACATPVVAGLAGGTASAVVDGIGGWRVDGEDPAAVADVIRAALLDPAGLSVMGDRGRAWVMEHHSWQARVRDLRHLVVQLAGKG